jgi:pyrroline-5-carboxylate reductase
LEQIYLVKETSRRQEAYMEEKKIAIVGAGNMGSAILRGVLGAKAVKPGNIWILEQAQELSKRICDELRVNAASSERELAHCDVVIFALKPKDMLAAVKRVSAVVPGGEQRIFVSVAAGFRLDTMNEAVGKNIDLVRVMPNLPCVVGEGMSVVFSENMEAAKYVRELFTCVGEAEIIGQEALFDVVTGLSGSGPGYLFLVIEALADGAVKMGLDRRLATRLAAQTVKGSGALACHEGVSPGELRERVASPGGTTIAGLSALEECGVRAAFIAAVEEATRRSKELG